MNRKPIPFIRIPNTMQKKLEYKKRDFVAIHSIAHHQLI